MKISRWNTVMIPNAGGIIDMIADSFVQNMLTDA